jgi:hypothetical protein
MVCMSLRPTEEGPAAAQSNGMGDMIADYYLLQQGGHQCCDDAGFMSEQCIGAGGCPCWQGTKAFSFRTRTKQMVTDVSFLFLFLVNSALWLIL